MVYFVHATTREPLEINERVTVRCDSIKIGSAVRPLTRLEALRKTYGRPDLCLMGVISGGIITERDLHSRFDHLRVRFLNAAGIRCRAEWFEPGNDLLSFIGEHGQAVHEIDSMDVDLLLKLDDELLMRLEAAASRSGMSTREFMLEAAQSTMRENPLLAWPFHSH